MSSDLNHVSNCDQLSKMLGEVAVDVHGVKGRHKQEIWWWHKLWKIHSSLREVLFSLLSFFLLCRLMSLSKTAFQSLSTFRKGWNMNARRASVQFSAPCWMLKNCTKLDPPSPLQPHGCSSRSAVEVSSFLLGRGKGRDRMKKQIDSLFSVEDMQSQLDMCICWSCGGHNITLIHPLKKRSWQVADLKFLKTEESQILPTRPELTPGNLRGSNGNHKPFSNLEI